MIKNSLQSGINSAFEILLQDNILKKKHRETVRAFLSAQSEEGKIEEFGDMKEMSAGTALALKYCEESNAVRKSKKQDFEAFASASSILALVCNPMMDAAIENTEYSLPRL